MSQKKAEKLDLAARAGWLYYVAGYTQDEIANEFGISRQSAQRMVSLSISEKLIKVRLDHPISNCMQLASKLIKKYSLKKCDIVPSINGKNNNIGLGQAGAKMMTEYLESKEPLIMAIGTGRVLKMVANELSPMNCIQHRLLSLVGNMKIDGSASPHVVVSKIADKIKATYYPMPLPVIVSTEEEKELLQNQLSTKNVLDIAKKVTVSFVGIGHFNENAPLFKDNFITQTELNSLLKTKAVGEIIGWAYDINGNIIQGYTNNRVTSIPLTPNSDKTIIGIAAGEHKVQAIKSALEGKLINGLITNERCAEILLS